MLSDEEMYIKGIEDEPLIDCTIIPSSETRQSLSGLVYPHVLIIKDNPDYNRVVVRIKAGNVITIQRFIAYNKLEDVAFTDVVDLIWEMREDLFEALNEVAEATSIIHKFVSMGRSHTTRLIDRSAEFAKFLWNEPKDKS